MNKISWLIILLFIPIVFQFGLSSFKFLSFPAQDFQDFYNTGTWIREGQLGQVEFGKDIVRNPPPALLLFTLFSFLPILYAQAVWCIFSLIFFFVGTYFLLKILKLNNLKFWFFYLSLVFLFFPFRYNLGSGQVNNLLFMLITLSFYFILRKKNYQSSLNLALAILLKITPLLFLFTLLTQRKFKTILLTIGNIILINLLTIPIFGWEFYQKYLNTPGTFLDFSNPTYYNQSLSAFMYRLLYNRNLVIFIEIFLLILFLFIFYRLSKLPIKDKLSNLSSLWGISIIYILIFAPFAWQYHFVIIIFSLVTTFYLALKLKLRWYFFASIFLSVLLLGANIKNPLIIPEVHIIQPLILSHTLIGALLLLGLNFYLRIKSRTRS